MRQVIVCLVLIGLFAAPVDACIGARYAGLGWCGVAIADGPEASYWNPAAFAWARDGVMYGSIFGSKDFAAKYGNWGVHYVQDWDKWYSGIGYGFQIENNMAIGFNLGWCSYNDEYYNHISEIPFLDISFIYKQGNFVYGTLLQNIVNVRPEVAYITDYITITAGFYDLVNLSSIFYEESFHNFHMGIELRLNSFLALRGGYNSKYDRLLYGVGLVFKHCKIDLVNIDDEIYFTFTFVQ